MTFVKTRLLIERMAPGETAEVLLRGAEPIENVPASVTELGHAILEMERTGAPGNDAVGEARLVIRKTQGPPV